MSMFLKLTVISLNFEFLLTCLVLCYLFVTMYFMLLPLVQVTLEKEIFNLSGFHLVK